MLFIYPKEFNSIKTIERLNKVEPSIKFTQEPQANHSLLFLEMFLLIRNNEKFEFKVYRKATR